MSKYFDRAEGKGIIQLASLGFRAWIVAVSAALITGTQALLDLLALPFVLLYDIAGESVQAFILEPFGITAAGAAATESFFQGLEGFAALIGLPVSVTISLITLGIVILYLMLGPTSNFLPGLIVDNRIMEFFFTTAEEDEAGEE